MKKTAFLRLIIFSLFPFHEVFAAETKTVWNNESQVAIALTGGNSETESYTLKQISSIRKNKDSGNLVANFHRFETKNRETGEMIETARKWDLGARYGHDHTERLGSFIGHQVESDKFAGYRIRRNTDLGFRYVILRGEKYEINGEAGLRYVHQTNQDDMRDYYTAGRTYLEGIYRFREDTSGKIWAEYIDNFDIAQDRQFNYEASLTSEITSFLSVKLAYLSKTDNLPVPGADKTDSTFNVALVAKY